MPEPASTGVAIVGAGPMGLALACGLARRGVACVVLERGRVGASIESFPPGMGFLSPAAQLEIDGVAFPSAGPRVTPEEYLAYLDGVVRARGLDVRTGQEVVDLGREPDGRFRLRVQPADGAEGGAAPTWELRAERVVLAVGEFDRPVRLGVPGEDRPHVSHFFRGTEGLAGKRVVVVGGGNSATEAVQALAAAGARVTLCVRRDRFSRGGPLTRRNARRVRELAAHGRIDLRLRTEVTAIDADRVTCRGPDGAAVTLPADHVLLLTGYEPDLSLVVRAGGDPARPLRDMLTLETGVPGLYLAGTAASRANGFRSFIKHMPKHVVRIIAHLHGEPVPEEMLPPRRQRPQGRQGREGRTDGPGAERDGDGRDPRSGRLRRLAAWITGRRAASADPRR